MILDVDTLEKATQKLFSHLREKGISEVELKSDFYWEVSKDQRYDPYNDPTEKSLGQLSDDWEEVQKVASGQRETIGYVFVWLAALYRYIGEENPG